MGAFDLTPHITTGLALRTLFSPVLAVNEHSSRGQRQPLATDGQGFMVCDQPIVAIQSAEMDLEPLGMIMDIDWADFTKLVGSELDLLSVELQSQLGALDRPKREIENPQAQLGVDAIRICRQLDELANLQHVPALAMEIIEPSKLVDVYIVVVTDAPKRVTALDGVCVLVSRHHAPPSSLTPPRDHPHRSAIQNRHARFRRRSLPDRRIRNSTHRTRPARYILG